MVSSNNNFEYDLQFGQIWEQKIADILLNEKIEEATGLGDKMVLLCSPVVRPHFKKLTEKFIPNLIVISHNELGPDTKIKSLGTVRL